MIENDNLSAEEVALIRAALGLDTKTTAHRNRTAWNSGRPTFPTAMRLARLGLLVEDHAASYGRMVVFRVTQAGMNAVGIVRPKKTLLDLVPKVCAPLPLAA